jgi:hypothetical protein
MAIHITYESCSTECGQQGRACCLGAPVFGAQDRLTPDNVMEEYLINQNL